MKAAGEESDLSQQSEDSQNSQETNSSQEETDLLNPWSRQYSRRGTTPSRGPGQRIDQWVRRERRFRRCGPRAEAYNALVPAYRKELRKVLFEYLQWMRAIKKDPTFRKVIETQRELEDTEGFDRLKSIEPASDKHNQLLNSWFATTWQAAM